MHNNKTVFNLKEAFARALKTPVQTLRYVATHYPSKCAAITGTAGDILFCYQAWQESNYIGVAGAAIGGYASLHLILHADPKITAEDKASYVEPQDTRNIVSWMREPKKYPWEFAGLLRGGFLSCMLAGGVAGDSKGEIIYASAALAGYALKMFVAQKDPKDAVQATENSNLIVRGFTKACADVQTRPNFYAGCLWNAGLGVFAAEALQEEQYYKLASAAMYALPTIFIMLSSKRAQEFPPPAP